MPSAPRRIAGPAQALLCCALALLGGGACAQDSAISARGAEFFTIESVLAERDGHGAAGAPVSSETSAEPFGGAVFRAPEGGQWHRQRALAADMERDRATLARCRVDPARCPPHAARFLRIVAAAAARTGLNRLMEVGDAVDRSVRYVPDAVQHGVEDRWSSALSTFATLKGDCEDYAIAKYVALAEAGFPRGEMRILLVRDRSGGADHAVLAARVDGRWMILDNRRGGPVQDRDASGLRPVFSIDEAGVGLVATRRMIPPGFDGR